MPSWNPAGGLADPAGRPTGRGPCPPGTRREAWLTRLDARRDEARALLEPGGRGKLAAWRVFLMAASGTWAYDRGQEWVVSHYLFRART